MTLGYNAGATAARSMAAVAAATAIVVGHGVFSIFGHRSFDFVEASAETGALYRVQAR
jgi:hypothetical protein